MGVITDYKLVHDLLSQLIEIARRHGIDNRKPNWGLSGDIKKVNHIRQTIVNHSLPFALRQWARYSPNDPPDISLCNIAILDAIDLYVYKGNPNFKFSPFVYSELRKQQVSAHKKELRYLRGVIASKALPTFTVNREVILDLTKYQGHLNKLVQERYITKGLKRGLKRKLLKEDDLTKLLSKYPTNRLYSYIDMIRDNPKRIKVRINGKVKNNR